MPKNKFQSIYFKNPFSEMSTDGVSIGCRMEIANHSKYTEIQFRVGNMGAL